ncbi:PREDICTED: OTU domain-containing protein 5 isoform X2 [Nicrophorus vespilloides]|uniref:ubiquitinyl hydrolase 1 n=1 Tax=Nicrophorus vespilloides TaxID=110193 RepID=A0ABM1N8P2_NICVS|nr:PREDICTED: OTU domain-containing protein 5 isoform X2 [Nicrophorus vespilloides]
MTILPAKRTTAATDDKGESAQNVNVDRSNRQHNATNINDGNKTVARRPFRSATPEASDHCLRKRFKESSKHCRRKQTRERKSPRSEIPAEEGLEANASAAATVDSNNDEAATTARENDNNDNEDATGFNSEDEYGAPLRSVKPLTDEEWTTRDSLFSRCLSDLGYEIKLMNEDGACLFRAIADQIFGDQELHYMVRTSCMDYIVKNKDFFAAYVTEDFDKYVARKRKWNVHGNHLEIQAMSEMYNRTIEVYCYKIEPINIFNGSKINADEPIRLSYHRMCHYNSISNPNNPSVGVGLGLPSYHTIDLNRRRMVDAVRASENLLIEQTMLEDKLKATDWEATNEALEEEVARESYIQYFRDAEKRLKPQGHAAGSSSTITSSQSTSRSSLRRGSVSPKGSSSPKGGSSPKGAGYSMLGSLRSSPRSSSATSNATDTEFHFGLKPSTGQSPSTQNIFDYEHRFKVGYDLLKDTKETLPQDQPPCKSNKMLNPGNIIGEDDWDDGIMAQVLAESRMSYLDDLKRNSKKLGSPGPSTSR